MSSRSMEFFAENEARELLQHQHDYLRGSDVPGAAQEQYTDEYASTAQAHQFSELVIDPPAPADIKRLELKEATIVRRDTPPLIGVKKESPQMPEIEKVPENREAGSKPSQEPDNALHSKAADENGGEKQSVKGDDDGSEKAKLSDGSALKQGEEIVAELQLNAVKGSAGSQGQEIYAETLPGHSRTTAEKSSRGELTELPPPPPSFDATAKRAPSEVAGPDDPLLPAPQHSLIAVGEAHPTVAEVLSTSPDTPAGIAPIPTTAEVSPSELPEVPLPAPSVLGDAAVPDLEAVQPGTPPAAKASAEAVFMEDSAKPDTPSAPKPPAPESIASNPPKL